MQISFGDHTYKFTNPGPHTYKLAFTNKQGTTGAHPDGNRNWEGTYTITSQYFCNV